MAGGVRRKIFWNEPENRSGKIEKFASEFSNDASVRTNA